MAKNTGQLIIDLNGALVDKKNGYITATSQYTNYIQVVAPFDDTDSVSINFYLRNARISNYTQYMSLQRDDSNVPLVGRDVIDSAKDYYQDTKDWNVWIVPIDSLALAAISKWHAGTVDVSVTFRSFRNLEIEETGTYIGTFGSRKSISGGDIPETATIGDFYKCDYLDYYSDNSNLEYTLGDLAIYTSEGWIKGIAYETRLSTSSVEFGVDPAIYGQAIEDTRLDTTEMIIDRIAGLEAAILTSDSGGSYADNLYIRNGIDNNYPLIGTTLLSDKLYIEREDIGYHTTIENLVKELPELDASILRTTGTDSPYTGEGFYAANNVVLIGSATEAGISWDGTNLYIRGTIQSGTITDPDLLETLTGPAGADGADGSDGSDGITPVFGVDYFNGDAGAPFKFLGVLPWLSSLALISNPSKNDSYRITETEELWNWNGASWINMGVMTGLPGSDGTDGLSAYLHIAYANSLDGQTDFSTSVSVGKRYLGQKTDFTLEDSEIYSEYKWTLIKGADGSDGSDGATGDNAYLHIAYANNSTGETDFNTSWFLGATYIGTYTNAVLEDSELYTDYDWLLIKGADGSDGSDGAKGDNAYLHIAYATANDGSLGFSTTISTDKTYIGTYTNSIITDSEIYGDYDWLLIKGADGSNGTDGTDGDSAYLHIAYATNATGSEGFSTTISTDKTYIGTYTNSIEADSEIYGDYDWLLIKGADGADGSDGSDGISSYLHIAYATSSNGFWDFSTTVSTGATYIGTYTNTTEGDSGTYTDYNWSLIQGADGSDGEDGADGVDAYLHIAYSNSSDGQTDFSTSVATDKKYMGTYTNSTVTDSEIYGDYTWLLIQGSDGSNGTDGTDGVNAYLHIAYATSANGDTGFSTTVSTDKTYIGQYTNSTVTDSETYTDYNWTKIVGPAGSDGSDGLQYYLHIAYATNATGTTGFSTTVSTGATYIGTYTDTNVTDSSTAGLYTWVLFKGADGTDGADGADGADGTSVVLKGSVATVSALPTTATIGDLYVVEADGDGYVWNGSSWTNAGAIQGPAGTDGTDGTDGDDGLNAYVHFAYATNAIGSENFSTSSFSTAYYIGTYTDFTLADSTTYSDYSWSLFRGADGADGSDGSNGIAAYVHYAYATNATGSEGFSTTYTGVEKYIGFYTNSTLADSTTYTDYEWALFTGADGTNGTDGSDGLASYIHYAYSTASDGSTDFSTSYNGTEKYVGWYTDNTLEDSITYTDYEWALFTGADGADGDNGLAAVIHYAYATNATGSEGFSTTYTNVETYVGWYTDYTSEDSETYTDYEWALFKGQPGEDGADGADGANGLPAYIHYAYSTVGTGLSGTLEYTGVEDYIGWYTDFTEKDSTDWSLYNWNIFKGQTGDTGENGLDGIDGSDGADGLPAYIHYAYAITDPDAVGYDPIGDFSLSFSGDQYYIGWYTDFTEADSELYSDYDWSYFKGPKGEDGADGADGANGLPAYIHYAYSITDPDAVGYDPIGDFSLSFSGDQYYIGWYTDFTEADSELYSDYDWSYFKGPTGDNGLPAYIHFAYSITNPDSIEVTYDPTDNFTRTFTGDEYYIGFYTGFIDNDDSFDYTDYTWSVFRGYDGATGDKGDSAKWITITGKNAFKFVVNSDVPTYTSITLSAKVNNTIGLAWYYSTDNGFTWTDLSYSNSNYVLTYDNAIWGTNDSLLFMYQDSLVGPREGIYDMFSVYKIYETGTVTGWLTDENHVVPTNSIGQDYDISVMETTGGEFKLVYGLTDLDPADVTFSLTTPALDGGLTLTIDNATGIYTVSETVSNGWTSDESSWTLRAVYGDATIDRVFRMIKQIPGPAGDSIIGPAGPGLVYRGVFSSESIYYATDIRKDVVLYPDEATGAYYSLKPAYNNATGTWVAGEWDTMTSFASVATDLLLAQDATVTKGLVIGASSSDTTAFIRTYNMASLLSGAGFYLSGDGKFRLGNTSGDNLYWNGSLLSVTGNITAQSLSLRNNAIITKGLTMGNVDEKGFIASYEMSSLTDTLHDGFYINGDGHFTFGKYGYNAITWDGNNLDILLPFTVRESSMATEQSLYFQITNNTTTGHTYYRRYTDLSSSTNTPTAWVSADYILAGETETNYITSLDYGQSYYVEFRESTDDATIQGLYVFTSNVYIDTSWAYGTFGITVTDNDGNAGDGGTLTVQKEYAIKSGTSEIWTIDGYVTMNTKLERATISLPYTLYDATLQVTVKGDDNDGAGLDGVYGSVNSTTATSFSILHDFTGSNNSLTFYFQLTGRRVTV